MNKNEINKAMLIYNLVAQYYEPSNQSRCLLWCYRNVVNKQYPMSVRTFWRYMGIARKHISNNGYNKLGHFDG